MRKFISLFLLLSALSPEYVLAQNTADSILLQAGLQECIQYALKHQPTVQQYKIDEDITDSDIRSRLSEWYPQVSFAYNLQHNILLPTSLIPNENGVKREVTLGAYNTSNLQLALSQSIFNRDVFLARRTASSVRSQSRFLSENNRIEVVVAVSKAFYDLLLTQKQADVLDENIVRLERSLKDAYNQYQGGIVDKVDYKRAQIALNNTRADKRRTLADIHAKYQYLKELMGYPVPRPLSVMYDSIKMERDAVMDTLQGMAPSNRIEYKLLETERTLSRFNLLYNKWGYLPSLSAVANYSPTFLSDKFGDLYRTAYPTSFIGFQISLPIFQGGKRLHQVRTAELQVSRLELDLNSLSNRINTEYAEALAAYKGNFATWTALKENIGLAEDVYNTLRLQYNAGIKTYLDVIIAETDLRTAQINQLNALYQVLASKLDMQKALGTITY